MCICVRIFILYTHACIKCQSNTYFKIRLPAKYQLCHLYPSVIEMVLTNFPFDKQDRAFGEIKKSFKIYVVPVSETDLALTDFTGETDCQIVACPLWLWHCVRLNLCVCVCKYYVYQTEASLCIYHICARKCTKFSSCLCPKSMTSCACAYVYVCAYIHMFYMLIHLLCVYVYVQARVCTSVSASWRVLGRLRKIDGSCSAVWYMWILVWSSKLARPAISFQVSECPSVANPHAHTPKHKRIRLHKIHIRAKRTFGSHDA